MYISYHLRLFAKIIVRVKQVDVIVIVSKLIPPIRQVFYLLIANSDQSIDFAV